MSEFEKQNEEAFDMIRHNRECHPGGTPVRIITDDKMNALVNRAEAAERRARDAETKCSKLEFDIRMLRAVRVVRYLAAAGCAIGGFLLGLVL